MPFSLISSMATSSHRLLLRLSILFGLLAIAANARPGRHFHPCKTLIFFSTSSYSSSYPRLGQNPDFPLQNPSSVFFGRPSITFFLTEVRSIDPRPTFLVDRATVDEQNRDLPFDFSSSVGASFRERTKDILKVIGSLLLGVGCGALTSATLFLIWSLLTLDRFEYSASDDDEGEDASPKKGGYVTIPTGDFQVTAPPAKEVV